MATQCSICFKHSKKLKHVTIRVSSDDQIVIGSDKCVHIEMNICPNCLVKPKDAVLDFHHSFETYIKNCIYDWLKDPMIPIA